MENNLNENEIEHHVKILTEDAFQLSGDETLERIILLGFKNDPALYERFKQKLIDWLPVGTGVSLRGSVVTNTRHEDGTPFDSKGVGTSDLDLTLHGSEVLAMYNEYYIPALHSKPLCDKDSGIATSELNDFRCELQKMVERPVNIHATANVVMYVREFLGAPYFMIIEPAETAVANDAETA